MMKNITINTIIAIDPPLNPSLFSGGGVVRIGADISVDFDGGALVEIKTGLGVDLIVGIGVICP